MGFSVLDDFVNHSGMAAILQRHAVDVTAIGAQIDLVAPNGLAVYTGIDIPGNIAAIVDVYPSEIGQEAQGLGHVAFEIVGHVKNTDFIIVKSDGERVVVICGHGFGLAAAGGEVNGHLGRQWGTAMGISFHDQEPLI